jgi:alpha-ketoglutarate-dependent taurine dioxygenase
MSLTTIDLKPRVGSEVKTDVGALLSGAISAELRALLDRRGVILFRGMKLEDQQQLAFTKTLGAVREEGEGGLMKVTFDKKENPVYAEYFAGTFYWHMDGTYDEVPPLASVLTPRVLAPSGGQTEFTNTYAAYEDLPESEQQFLEKLRVVHTMEQAMRAAVPTPSDELVKAWRGYPVRRHPLVWRHRSGRKSLVLSTSASQVVGMDEKESAALLRRLMEWATQPHYIYQHTWQMNDLLIWDNTGTMHRVLPFDVQCGRRLHRYTLLGEEPVAAA